MSHLIKKVEALPECFIKVSFLCGDVKKYDVKKICDSLPQFKSLLIDEKLFYDVKVDVGGYGISWNDDLDLEAETIWEDGILIETEKELDINRLVAYQIMSARESVKMTQKQLSEKTGIYQADISKIERGIGNPSIATLERLAKGIGGKLEIKITVEE